MRKKTTLLVQDCKKWDSQWLKLIFVNVIVINGTTESFSLTFLLRSWRTVTQLERTKKKLTFFHVNCMFCQSCTLTQIVPFSVQLWALVTGISVIFLFSEELQRRKQQRQKKLRMEKRREQKSVASGATSYSSADRSAASKYLLCMFS